MSARNSTEGKARRRAERARAKRHHVRVGGYRLHLTTAELEAYEAQALELATSLVGLGPFIPGGAK